MYICYMKITLKERAEILNLSKDYYERCPKRKDYDKIIDATVKLVLNKIKQSLE